MKKTQFIELLKTISKTKVTFFSIILFVTMSLALFLGVGWSGESLIKTTETYFEKSLMHDAQIQTVYGYEKDKINDLLTIDGVDEVEGMYQAYSFMKLEEINYQVRIISLTKNIDPAVQINGVLPKNSGEVALTNYWSKEHNVKIGDTITLENEISDLSISGEPFLKVNTFTVTATIDTAPYLNRYSDTYGVSIPYSIPVNCLAYVDVSSINENCFLGYTDVLIRSNLLREFKYFSQEYKENAKELKTKIEDFLNNSDFNVSLAFSNSSYIGIEMINKIFGDLKFSMAGLFVVVGLCVSFFAILRMVHDQCTLIGTKKALGFSKRKITFFYLMYVFFAVLIGSILGVLTSRFIVEPILVVSMCDIYTFDKVFYLVKYLDAAVFFLVELALQMLATLISCRGLLSKKAVELLRGENTINTKKRWYEKTRLWKKTPLLRKSVINNFFNDKRRVASTLFGVAACSSLIICALTINNNILDSFSIQYNEIYHYDSILFYDSSKNIQSIEDDLTTKNIEFSEVYNTFVYVDLPNGKSIASYLFVFDDENFTKMVTLKTLGGKKLEVENGIYSSCSYQQEFRPKKDDEITLVDLLQNKHSIKCNGYFEYYMMNNLFIMNASTYEAEFSQTFVPNTLFFNRGNYKIADLADNYSSYEGFIYLNDDYSSNKVSFDIFADVFTIVVFVYLGVAIAMALLVLLNLLVMYVNEKKKELIVLMINGYSRKDAKKYIYSDTIILSIFGIIIGVLFGTLMSNISLLAYKNETIYFKSGFNLWACIIGILLSILLTLVTSFIAIRRINKMKLKDINTN